MANRDDIAVVGLTARRRGMAAFLDVIERVGNRLPDQTTIFVLLAVVTVLVSWLASSAGWSTVHPVTGATVNIFNLASRDGLQWALGSVVGNFTGFAPLGTVLVAMIGVGLAERTGLFAALLKALVTAVPPAAITPTIVFAGIMSHLAADAGNVLLPPLAAMLYASRGRHPIAGIAAAFGGIGAGFSANLLLSAIDPMLAGLTQSAARLFDPTYEVAASCNYTFNVASTVLLTLVGWFVSVKIVEPRLGAWRPAAGEGGEVVAFDALTPRERTGLIVAGLVFAATIAVIVLLVVPADAVLRDGEGAIRPFYASLVGLIMIVFVLPGAAYGLVTGGIRSDRDAATMMNQTMAGMGGYIVMAFFAGQFVAWFGKSNLGLVIAIEGATFLESIDLTGLPLIVAFVVFIAVSDLFMVSASAKWAIFAPVFVPMLMTLGHSPETTQGCYRVGDSVFNVITPLNVYMAIVVGFAQRYDKNAGLGTLIAAMVPYSLTFLVVWTIFLVIWMSLGMPLGPGAPLAYPA